MFFVVETVTEDDGFTFALINSSNNDRTSVGGDIDLGELLGYAGDSRKVSPPTALTDFLDPAASLADKGLCRPKWPLNSTFMKTAASMTIASRATMRANRPAMTPPQTCWSIQV